MTRTGHRRRHGQRVPRIEIRIVTDAGTVEYRHAKGDPCPDGTTTPGPTAAEFAEAHALVLKYIGALPLTKR